MMLILTLKEDKMRIASTLSPMVALAFGVAFAAPISGLAVDGVHLFHKHAIQMHRVAYAGISSNATAGGGASSRFGPLCERDQWTESKSR